MVVFDPTQEVEIKRRRRLAEALQKQGQARPTEVVGGFAVPQSGFEGLARGLAGFAGGYQGAQADTMEQEQVKQRQALLTEALGKLGTDQKGAGAMLAQDPSMLAAGLGLITDANKTDRAQILADAQFKQKQQLAKEAQTNALIAAGVKSGTLGVDSSGNVTPTGIKPGPKAPTGYKYGADGVTLEAIPGGPAEKIDAGSAGKLSIIKSFQDNLPMIQQSLIDKFDPVDFNLNSGDTGRARRALREAIGGALYLKTGAAATPGEVDEQESIYMPNSTDTKETRQNKIKMLNNFLSQSGDTITTGRGGMQPPSPSNDAALAAARDAISKGADPIAVKKRLEENGISADGL